MRENFIKIILSITLLGILTGCYGKSKTAVVPLDSLTLFLKKNYEMEIDTILIKDGNYNNLRIQIQNVSRKSLVITPENKGNVLISGNSGFLIEQSKNIRLEGFVYKNTVGNIFRINSSTGIGVGNSYFLSCGNNPLASLIRIAEGASNNEIYNNIFDDNRAGGVSIVNNDKYISDGLCRNNVIRNNVFRKVKGVKELYPNSNGNGMEAIQVGQMTSVKAISQNLGTIIERNRFEQFIGDQVEIISVKSSSNKISDNDFVDCMGGLSIRAGNNNLIMDNEFLRVGRAIRLYGSGHRVENNKLYDVKVGIMIPSADFQTGEKLRVKDGYYMARDCVIEGNLIVNATDKAILTGNADKRNLPEALIFKNNKVLVDNETDTMEKLVSILTKDKNVSSFNVSNFVGKSTKEDRISIKPSSLKRNETGPNWIIK